MSDTRVTTQPMIRQHFGDMATLPHRQLAEATSFVAHLQEAAGNGQSISPDKIETGKHMLAEIEERLEVAAFSVAVLAGEENDFSKIDAISTNIDRVSTAAAGLRRALAGM